MTGRWELRAHDSIHDRLEALEAGAIPDEVWDAALTLLETVMTDPDSCRAQGIRWPRSEVSGWRVTVRAGRYDIAVWWSVVEGASFVWGLTSDPPLD